MLLKRLQRLRNSEPDESGTDTLEAVESEEIIEEEAESDDSSVDSEEKSEEATDSDELVVTIDGEEQEEEEKQAPNWVKELRRKNREDQRKIRELEEKLAQGNAPERKDDPGKEPELEDFDYDADAFKAAFKEWTAKKAQFEQNKEAIRRQQEEAAKEWQSVQETYAKGKARFPKEKMAEAEEEVVSVLSAPRQAMLMDMADDSAQLVIALGSSPETLRKLASIKSDAKFIKELAKVEMNVKVQPKKTPPPPERTISGSGKTPGAGQANLERLREQAEKTGDYTEYYAAKSKSKAR